MRDATGTGGTGTKECTVPVIAQVLEAVRFGKSPRHCEDDIADLQIDRALGPAPVDDEQVLLEFLTQAARLDRLRRDAPERLGTSLIQQAQACTQVSDERLVADSQPAGDDEDLLRGGRLG